MYKFNYLLIKELEDNKKKLRHLRSLPIPETVGELINLIDLITDLEEKNFEIRRRLGENN